jgi:outer membrane protein assembly factor BamE (lipoprotein component of BamABCDE complex)
MKFVILALLGTLMLSSCVTGGKMTGLREGLTKEEVTRIIGSPDGYQRSGDYEVMLYIERRTPAWSFFSGTFQDLVDYSVILKDGRVVEYGPGRIHQRDSGGIPFVRLPAR